MDDSRYDCEKGFIIFLWNYTQKHMILKNSLVLRRHIFFLVFYAKFELQTRFLSFVAYGFLDMVKNRHAHTFTHKKVIVPVY